MGLTITDECILDWSDAGLSIDSIESNIDAYFIKLDELIETVRNAAHLDNHEIISYAIHHIGSTSKVVGALAVSDACKYRGDDLNQFIAQVEMLKKPTREAFDQCLSRLRNVSAKSKDVK